ncbi:MAG: carotenoid oxygenase family protein [Microthrixaceae bacterium]|nr:carotenoid oxygenase family protein [Microthrixaceae bacterium]
MDLETVDVGSVPQLQGIFAPVTRELDRVALEVTQGSLPEDINGSYLRNGPNPRFTPLGSYTYPLDGDGMVHGVSFGAGEAHYTNRFVRTPALDVEEAAGRALWPGIMTGSFPSAEDVGEELAGSFRDMVDINVIRHAGRILALAEGDRAFELDESLATVGPWNADGALPNGLCAHPKIDPVSGELVVFRYGITEEPWLTWAALAADGSVSRPETPIAIDAPYMIHDCAITEAHLVLYVCPLRFDIESMLTGGSMLAWEPERGTRIAVIDRASGEVSWFGTDTFWVWHIANAFCTDTASGHRQVVVDLPVWNHCGMGIVEEPSTGRVLRQRFVPDTGEMSTEVLSEEMTEFPRVDDRLVGAEHRWFHVASKDPDHPTSAAGEWNRLLRFDTATGAVQDRRGGKRCFGEAVFVPRAGADAASGEGYLLTYTYDTETLRTELVLLDATDIAAEPVATLAMPQRVPFGLHGNWLPA